MEDLWVKLNPITKLKLFRTVKEVIFSQMDKDKITPERADEILGYTKKYVVDIRIPKVAKQFYIHLGERFPELVGIKNKFKMEGEEKIDKIFSLLIDEFMENENIDLANEIMEQMDESKDQNLFIEKLKEKYPIEFNKVFAKFY